MTFKRCNQLAVGATDLDRRNQLTFFSFISTGILLAQISPGSAEANIA